MRRIIRALLAIAAASSTIIVEAQTAEQEFSLNLDREPLVVMLTGLSRQTALNVSYIGTESSNPQEIPVGSFQGSYVADSALVAIQEGSQLTYEKVNKKATAVIPHARVARLAQAESRTAQRGTPVVPTRDRAAAASDARDLGERSLEEIIVTAQKRSERLQDVPVPVTAVSADALVENNQRELKEYFKNIPGLNFTSGNRGEPFVAIRGITTTPFSNPTVGVTVDDVPYGSTTLRGGGLIAPDLDPSDLERIEVLRGPQGTLYGVSSIGGLIKYVTVDPSTDSFSGRIQTSISNIRNGDELGYHVRGSVNVPHGDTFAINASGFARRDPGYVDNPALGIEGVNEGDGGGGRVAALWRPSKDFSLKVSALMQERNTDGSPLVFVLPGLGDLEQSYVRGSGWYKRKFEAYSATLNGKLGSVDLTSLSGFNITRIRDSVDTSPFFGGIAFATFGVGGAPITDDYKTEKFSQEIRLSAPIGERFEWLLGGFYTDERARTISDIHAVDPLSGTVVGLVGHQEYPTTYEEYAAFLTLTFHITDRFDVQVGGRHSHNEQTYADSGPLFSPLTGGLPTPKITIDDEAFTYLVTPRFKVSQDLMLYARFASGYRAGGINPTASTSPVPRGFEPDTTQNYELGVKGNVANGAFSYDVSVYHIDWKDIQTSYLPPGGVAYQANGSRAKSQGVELAIETRPLAGMRVTATFSWNDAQLTEDFPVNSQVRGFDGDQLPFSSELSGSLGIDQDFLLSNDLIASVGASVSYMGDRKGLFQGTPLRQSYESYTLVDVRAGVEWGSWAINAFGSNVTDKRGVLGGGIGGINPAAFVLVQPRTVGLSLSKAF